MNRNAVYVHITERNVVCAVCHKPITGRDLESQHLVHEPDCHNNPNSPFRVPIFIKCNCTGVAHPQCCPTCLRNQ